MPSSHILRFIHSLLPVLQVVLRNIITGFILRRITKKKQCALYKLMLYSLNGYWSRTAIKELISLSKQSMLCWVNGWQNASVWKVEYRIITRNSSIWPLTSGNIRFQDDIQPLCTVNNHFLSKYPYNLLHLPKCAVHTPSALVVCVLYVWYVPKSHLITFIFNIGCC